jgi:hypothetical protein
MKTLAAVIAALLLLAASPAMSEGDAPKCWDTQTGKYVSCEGPWFHTCKRVGDTLKCTFTNKIHV